VNQWHKTVAIPPKKTHFNNRNSNQKTQKVSIMKKKKKMLHSPGKNPQTLIFPKISTQK
jgi:hypothetical protein